MRPSWLVLLLICLLEVTALLDAESLGLALCAGNLGSVIGGHEAAEIGVLRIHSRVISFPLRIPCQVERIHSLAIFFDGKAVQMLIPRH